MDKIIPGNKIAPEGPDDPLSFLLSVPEFLLTNSHARIFVNLSFVFSSTLTICAVTLIAISMDVMFTVRYFLCIFGNFYAAISIYVLVSRHDIFHYMLDTYFTHFWSYTDITGPTLTSIQNSIKSAKRMKYFIMAQLITSCILLMCPTKVDEEFLLPVLMINTMFGHYGDYIGIFFRMFVPPYALCMVAPNFVLMYAIIHVRLQIQILNERIKNIARVQVVSKDSDEVEGDTYRRLVECIKHHLLLKKLCSLLNDFIYVPVLIFTITGFFLCLLVLLFVYMRVSPSSNIRVFAFMLNVVTMILNFALIGQSLIEEIYKATYSAFTFMINMF